MRGFISLPLIIILIVVTVTGISWYMFSAKPEFKTSPSVNISLTPTPKPTATPPLTPTLLPTKTSTPSPQSSSLPLVDCTGPDGKLVKLTQKACNDFFKSWATPTPSPTPTIAASTQVSGCAAYNQGGDLGQLTVNIQPQSGQSLVGDAGVTISRKYSECTGVDPGFPLTQIIKQGSTSTSFSGMRPGPFHIEVLYHGKTLGQDVNISSGSNSTSVTVSN